MSLFSFFFLLNEHLHLSSKNEPKLAYEMTQEGGAGGMAVFYYLTKNVGTTDASMEFLTEHELNITLSAPEGVQVENEGILTQEIYSQNGARTVRLRPGQTLKHKIIVRTRDLPKGEYTLSAQLSTHNIYAALRTATIQVK